MNFRGILGHAGGGIRHLADLGNGAAVNIIAHRADGDLRLLAFLQGQNVRFINADGDGHADIGIQGHNTGAFAGGGRSGGGIQGRGVGSIFLKFHAADNAVHTCQQSAIPVDGQKIHQILFQFFTLPQQGIIVGSEAGVLQIEQGAACADLVIFLGNDAADGTGKTGDTQRIVDVQLCFADLGTVGGGNGYFLTVLGAVVGDQHRGSTASRRRNLALQHLAVFPGHGHQIALAEFGGLQIRSHIAIQTQNRQSAMLCHAQ